MGANDPVYVGYMYGKNFKRQTFDNTYIGFDSNSSEIQWSDDYYFD